jgi:hypothetical protein
MSSSARGERARLNAALRKLADIKIADLARDELREQDLSFRGGLAYFEKTLALFRELERSNLRQVPSDYLKIVADHAERVLAQFEEILRFTGEGIQDPAAVRSHLIGEIRDSYRTVHDDIALVIQRPMSELERGTQAPWYAGMPLAALLLAVFVGCVYVAYRFTPAVQMAQDFLDTLRGLMPHP